MLCCMPVEGALLVLGAAAAKAVLRIWLDDAGIASAISYETVDLIKLGLQSERDQRKLRRVIESMGDRISDQLQPLIDMEFSNLPENELRVAISTVQEALDAYPIDLRELVVNNIEPQYLEGRLKPKVRAALDGAYAASDTYELAYLLLSQTCAAICTIAVTLPQFDTVAMKEILERETELITLVDTRLAELEKSLFELRSVPLSADEKFELRYLRSITAALSSVSLLGLDIGNRSRIYPLDIAYLNLDADVAGKARSQPDSSTQVTVRIGDRPRTLIRGIAGSGKTTLLQWLAVQLAKKSELPPELEKWQGRIPFFLRLRQHVDSPLPAPEKFLIDATPNIIGQMPDGWVHRVLDAKRGVLLVDGLDEIHEDRRGEVGDWLISLLNDFPDTVAVVTSRPPAASDEWKELREFTFIDLRDMTPNQIGMFVNHWYLAAEVGATARDEVSDLRTWRSALLAEFQNRSYLTQLSSTPLLCAMICATNRERRGSLPRDRRELYRAAIDMLIERRDKEKGQSSAKTVYDEFQGPQKWLILQHFALWLLENKYIDCAISDAVEQFGERARSILASNAPISVEQIFDAFLLRSGVLREQVPGRIDFVHRTFQEYLAAHELLRVNKIGEIVDNASDDLWRETIIFAAGQAGQVDESKQRSILEQILDQGDKDAGRRHSLHLLAVACMETSPDLPQDLRDRLGQALRACLPPRNLTEAAAVASAGSVAVPLIVEAYRLKPSWEQSRALVRALVLIGGPEALEALRAFSDESRLGVTRELVRGWSSFNAVEYARIVLPKVRITDELVIDDPAKLAGLHFLKGVQAIHIQLRSRGQEIARLASKITAPTFLDLSDSKGVTSLDFLSLLPNATGLRIDNCPDLANTDGLQYARVLRSLSLQGCPLVYKLARIGNLKHLNLVNVSSCPGLSEIGALDGAANLAELDISATLVRTLPSGLANLEELWADATPNLSLRGAVGSSQLKRVTISDSRTVSTEDLEQWLSNCERIEELRLMGLATMTRFPALNAATAESLKVCIASRNPKLSDVENITGLKALKALSLAGARSLEDLPSLSGLSRLDDVNLCGCSGLRLEPGVLPESVEFLSLGGVKPSGKLEVGKRKKIVVLDVRQYADYRNIQSKATTTFFIQDAPNSLQGSRAAAELLARANHLGRFRPSIVRPPGSLMGSFSEYSDTLQSIAYRELTQLSEGSLRQEPLWRTDRASPTEGTQELLAERLTFRTYTPRWTQFPMSGEWRSEAGSFRYIFCPYAAFTVARSSGRFRFFSYHSGQVISEVWANDAAKLHTDDSLDNAWKPGPLAAIISPGRSGKQLMVPLLITSHQALAPTEGLTAI